MLPLCFEKKKRTKRDEIEAASRFEWMLVFSSFYRTHIELLPARSRSLCCVTSHGRVVVVKKLLLLSNLIIPLFDFIRARCEYKSRWKKRTIQKKSGKVYFQTKTMMIPQTRRRLRRDLNWWSKLPRSPRWRRRLPRAATFPRARSCLLCLLLRPPS